MCTFGSLQNEKKKNKNWKRQLISIQETPCWLKTVYWMQDFLGNREDEIAEEGDDHGEGKNFKPYFEK